MINNIYINKYSIIICLLIVILIAFYYTNYYKHSVIVNTGCENIAYQWNLEDEIRKFTMKQDSLLKT